MGLIILFGTIYIFHCIIQLAFSFFLQYFSKNFQFQLNKLFPIDTKVLLIKYGKQIGPQSQRICPSHEE